MNFYERALELREETVAHRRWLHRNAEVRFDEDVCPIGSACLAHCAVR